MLNWQPIRSGRSVQPSFLFDLAACCPGAELDSRAMDFYQTNLLLCSILCFGKFSSIKELELVGQAPSLSSLMHSSPVQKIYKSSKFKLRDTLHPQRSLRLTAAHSI